jgi:hypothetical protein
VSLGGAALLALLLALPGTAAAQQPPAAPADTATIEDPAILTRLGFDRLRFRGLGVAAGLVKPSQMVTTESYSLEAEYGEIVPRVQLVFSATFWGSHLNEATLRRYRQQLGEVVDDPTGDYQISLGRVRVSDIALAIDGRWSPARYRSTFLRPYAGAGIAAHVLNAEGWAFSDTFVERALDNIAVAPVVVAGVDAVFFRQIALGMQGRYDLVNAARHGSLRALATYYFDHAPRRPARAEAR